jgi:chemotaxis protein CheC
VISSYSDLNEVYIDALKELGNIGAGNAATSLGVLLNDDVAIGLPEVRVEDADDVVRALGGAEKMCVAVLINFDGDAHGVVLFILTMDDAIGITDIIADDPADDPKPAPAPASAAAPEPPAQSPEAAPKAATEATPAKSPLSPLKISGIREFGNILGSSYLGSVAAITEMQINMSVPLVAIDMVGAVLSTPIAEFGSPDSKVMFIEESFSTKARSLSSRIIMFTDMGTLDNVMHRLGLTQ